MARKREMNEDRGCETEIRNLRRVVRDLVALSAMPSVWVDPDLRRSIENLTDVVQAALRARLVCVRIELPDGARFETVSATGLKNSSRSTPELGLLFDSINAHSLELVSIPRFNGSGPLNLLLRPIYSSQKQIGVLAAGYPGEARPDENAQLILHVAANQLNLLLERHRDQEERLARVRAEETLRQAEHHYRQLVEALPAAIYTCDAQGRITMYNEAAASLWGRRPRIGEDTWCGSAKIWNPDGTNLPIDECPMAVAIREGRPVRGREIIVERPDGSRSLVLPHPDPIRDQTGAIVGAVNMLVDIGPIKRAEQAARASEHHLETLLDLMPAAVYACDAQGRITFFNRRAAELWGREPKLNDDHQKFCAAYRCWFDTEVLAPADTPMAVAVREGKAFRNLEPVLERPDGKRISVLVNIDPLVDSTGKLAGAINVFQDVTALKQAEVVLREQKETLELIVQDAPLQEIMERLIGLIERQRHGLIGSVLLLEEDGEHLRPFAGKNVPKGWSDLINPLKIGPNAGSCGTAAFTRAPVIVEDIATDPLWAALREPALGYGFRACWSIPIRASNGKVLGTFAGYYPEPQRPADLEWNLVEILSQTASLALERQQAQEARQKLSALVENSPNFVGIASIGGKVLFVNQAGRALVGLDADKVSQTDVLEYFAEKERPRIESEVIPELLKAGHWDGEVWFKHFKTGALIPMTWNAFVIPDAKTGEPAFLACASTDITERKKVEEALRQSERLFRDLANSMPQIVWAARPDGFVDYYNDRWYEFTGFPERYGDESWIPILHPDDVQRRLEGYYRCIREERPFQMEYRFKDRRSGGYRWYLGRALPIRDESGQVIRWFGTCTDIDDQKRAAEKLEETVSERTASLREAVAQMEEFSYTVSHDLRAPLRAMQGYSDTLLHEHSQALNHDALRYLRRIAENSSRLDKMILDVLTFSRLARADVKLEAVPLNRIVRSIVENYAGMQPPHAQIEVDCPHTVMGHEPSLIQAVSNLLTNSIKFVAPGVTPKIRIWSVQDGDRVILHVRDNGIGIPPKYQSRLFNMFERVHPNLKYDGTGVGLAIVRKAVERMGGKVGMESDGINGSCFWLEVRGIAQPVSF